MPTFEAMRAGYGNMWRSMKVRPEVIPAADKVARGIIRDYAQYEPVERKTGVPWFFVGVLHNRESGRKFNTYLGNGQILSKRTTIVPIGRGPFPDFLTGAIDALKIDKLDHVHDWSIERMLYAIESFNGFGYGQYNVNSPYVWAGTHHYTRGKYIRDHVFDANTVDKQLGSAVVLARLCALSPEIHNRINQAAPAPKPDVVPIPPPSKNEGGTAAGATVGVLAVIMAAAEWFQDHLLEISIAAAALGIVGWLALYRYRKGRFPWNSTGDPLPAPLPLPPPSSEPSLEQLSAARLELSSVASPEVPLPPPSEPKLTLQPSAKPSPKTRKRPTSSRVSKRSAAKKSSPKRKRKSRATNKKG